MMLKPGLFWIFVGERGEIGGEGGRAGNTGKRAYLVLLIHLHWLRS